MRLPLPPSHIIHTTLHIYTAQLIAALLLTLMLLWHLSTAALVENYEMPRWWVRAFLAELVTEWRVGVWVGVGVLVPVDCVVALLGVDWGCAVLRSREGGVGVNMDGINEREQERQRNDHTTHTSTPSQASPHDSLSTTSSNTPPPSNKPYKHHPFLHPALPPPARLALLTLFDMLILTLLTAHIATYILSLPTALAFCTAPAVLAHPDYEVGDTDVLMSMHDRCMGLNVDIHVAGGFAVFMAIVLGLLHFAALLFRLAAVVVVGWDVVVGVGNGSGEHEVGAEEALSSRASSAQGSLASRRSVPRVDGAVSPLDSRGGAISVSAE